ncbi:unnamed protein product [Diatraea saccharalis]|uniref:Uncharacterized protein n=1 Tax=Diatraea saccharalis TaxID=40085 RepID=A0A9N9R6N1_9NEOP|nr:unnamed protein product [Diatraea saccharalis]
MKIMQKSEGGKVRPVGVRKIDFLSECHRKGFTRFKNKYAGNEVIDKYWLNEIRNPHAVKVPLDQSAFNSNQSKSTILAVLCGIHNVVINSDNTPDEYKKVWECMWHSLAVKGPVVVMEDERNWENGIPSGWRWTALLDTVQTIVLELWHVTARNTVTVRFQSDDQQCKVTISSSPQIHGNRWKSWINRSVLMCQHFVWWILRARCSHFRCKSDTVQDKYKKTSRPVVGGKMCASALFLLVRLKRMRLMAYFNLLHISATFMETEPNPQPPIIVTPPQPSEVQDNFGIFILCFDPLELTPLQPQPVRSGNNQTSQIEFTETRTTRVATESGQITPRRSRSTRKKGTRRRRLRLASTEQAAQHFIQAVEEWRRFKMTQHNDYMELRREQNRIRADEIQVQKNWQGICERALDLLEKIVNKYCNE